MISTDSVGTEHKTNFGVVYGWALGALRHRNVAKVGIVAAVFSVLMSPAFAATYYVDPQTGNDANSGISTTAPWKSVPGMTGTSTWGGITSAKKVPAGTVIEIRAGAIFTGKRWVIDKTYFQSGTASSPIMIRVSPNWGSGNVVIDGRGAIVPKWNGGIQVTDLSHIIIRGADAKRRIEIKNYSAHANVLHYNTGSDSSKMVGNQLIWFDCHHSSNYCISNSWQDNLLYQDGLVHNNGALEGGGVPKSGTGITMGDVADATGSNNILRRIVSYENGNGAKINDGSVSFGFQVTGGTNTLFDSCEAYGNGRDGFDGGRADNAGNASMVFLNSSSHDNKEDGFGLNSGPTGRVVAIHINTIASNNGQANWTAYDGARVEIYHAAGSASSANIHAFKSYPNWPAPTIRIRNSYLSVLPGAKQIHYYNPAEKGYPAFDSNYNLWVPAASNSERFDDDKLMDYTQPPEWKGINDNFGVGYKDAVLGLAAENFRIMGNAAPPKNLGIYLTSPAGVTVDRNGTARDNPPPIGPFATGKSINEKLSAPTNLKVK